MKKVSILVGPSGTGKTTFEELLKTLNKNLTTIVSTTNRTMRPNEINGINYYFSNTTVDEALKNKDNFIELLTFLDDEKMKNIFYGIEKESLKKQLEKNNEFIYSVINVEMAQALAKHLKETNKDIETDVVYFIPPKEKILSFLINRLGLSSENTEELQEFVINNQSLEELSFYKELSEGTQKTLSELPYRLTTIDEKIENMKQYQSDIESDVIVLQTPDSYFQEYSKQKELNLVDNRKIATPLKEMVAKLLNITLYDIEHDKDKNDDGQGKIRTILINIGNIIRNMKYKEIESKIKIENDLVEKEKLTDLLKKVNFKTFLIEKNAGNLNKIEKDYLIQYLFEGMNIKNYYGTDKEKVEEKLLYFVSDFFEELKKEHTKDELKNSDLLVTYYVDQAKSSTSKIICTDCRMLQELEEFSKSGPVYLVLRQFEDKNGQVFPKLYDKNDKPLDLYSLIDVFKDSLIYEDIVETLYEKFNVDRTETLGMVLTIDAFNQKNGIKIHSILEKDLSSLRSKIVPLFIPNGLNQENYVKDNKETIEKILKNSQIVLMGVAKAGKDHTLKMLEKTLYKMKNEKQNENDVPIIEKKKKEKEIDKKSGKKNGFKIVGDN